MKRIITAALLMAGLGLAHAQDLAWRDSSGVAQLFTQAQVPGTFVLYELGSTQLVGTNQARAQQRFVPASTFKIPNSLIGLSTGAVSSVDEVFHYDGQPRFLKSWEKDMGLREAIQVSNYPIYQELARRVGLKRMTAQVAALDYGNGQVGAVVDNFWVRGPLAISAIEQSQFLARLMDDQLPFSVEQQALVREMCLLEQGPGWRLYGKTGLSTAQQPGVGWWVGWLEQNGKRYSFALNMPMDQLEQGPQRMALGKASLRALGLL